jgi:excisionase family DNA binding protein
MTPAELLARPTLSVDEAAVVLGVGRGTLYEAIRRDEFPVLRIGRRIRVSSAVLRRMLDEGSAPALRAQE